MLKEKIGAIVIITFLLFAGLYGQDVIVTLVPYDGSEATFLQNQIKADTLASGGLLANHVYELKRDKYYFANATFTVPPGATLRLRAQEGTGKKPIIYLWETGTGSSPTRPPGWFVTLNGGNIELKDICIAGYYEWEPERVSGVQGGLISTSAAGGSIVIDGAILSNTNGNHIRTNQNVFKVKVTNTIFANMGALTTSNLGAGKGLDLRDVRVDSLILVNNTFVNYQDRAVRHYTTDPTKGPIMYGLIDHNTFINGMGYHGLLSLGNVGQEIIITNNLFMDAFALGEDSTDATRAAEWANTGETYPNGNNKITWIFSTPNDTTQWTVANNYWAISDSGWAFLNDFNFGPGSPLSDHIYGKLGSGASQAFTQTNITLGNTPRLMTNMMRWYESPTGGNKTKNTPSDLFVVERDDYDRRLLEYYRDTLDATYPKTHSAFVGADNNYPVGDLNWFPELKAQWEQGVIIQPTEVVVILEPYDGESEATFLQNQIKADTLASGGLLANHVYELKRDKYYFANATFTVPPGATLRLRAQEGTGKKPIIYLWETGTGSSPTRPPGWFVTLNGGNIELKDICIAGYYEWEPERVSGVQGGLISTSAAGGSIVIDGAILSNTNGNHIRTNQNVFKVKVTNTIFANMGALTTSNLGAGKGLDLRDVRVDSLILVNNTFVNYQDRAVRHYTTDPTKGPIMYGLIDHNTFINGMGYHGLLSLGNVGQEIIITNNLFMDAFALGEDSTDATRAAEWANTGETYPNGNNKITWIFSTPNDTTQWTVANNYWAISDSGWAFLNDFNFGPGSPLSDHIYGKLGSGASQAFTQTNITLGNTPRLMTNMMRWYESPTGGNKTKNTPSDLFVVERDDYDRRLLEYYRDTLDATYSSSSLAYTGADKGYPVGDLNWYPALKAKWLKGEELAISEFTSTKASKFMLKQNYPNPFNPTTQIAFDLNKSGYTTLTIYNLLGQMVDKPVAKHLPAGSYRITFDASHLAGGMYFYKLECAGQVNVRKMMLLK
ncbi:MAG TPA: T9SS type A sorting domain-containing protein [Candidatus Marinimicrobia bacterium]|nr:T9SS type A sorting domain-containing protein [Candidatus Neomarinimicrobiota bacterium]